MSNEINLTPFSLASHFPSHSYYYFLRNPPFAVLQALVHAPSLDENKRLMSVPITN